MLCIFLEYGGAGFSQQEDIRRLVGEQHSSWEQHNWRQREAYLRAFSYILEMLRKLTFLRLLEGSARRIPHCYLEQSRKRGKNACCLQVGKSELSREGICSDLPQL